MQHFPMPCCDGNSTGILNGLKGTTMDSHELYKPGQLDQSFALMVSALAKPGDKIIEGLVPTGAHLLHMAVGVSGESGELLDAIKKHAVYGKPLDRGNVLEELGDLEFYMEGLRQGIQATREEVLRHNMAKLSKRYSSGSYSDAQAQERADKV
jgi:NTP pyrophosphatase (non-canonical NTP hydrolase)